MEVSQFGLAIFCVSALIHGIILGLTYDVFSAVAVGNGKVFDPDLKTRLHNVKLPLIGRFDFNFQKRNRSFQTIVLFIYDLAFMLFVGISVSVLVYRFNDGKWRFAIVALLFLGYVIYCKILRRGVLALLEILLFLVKCILFYIMYFTFRPIKRMTLTACRSIKGGIDKMNKRHLESKIHKYSKRESSEMLCNAENYGTV